MAFEVTKRGWCELYTFLRLLTEGKVTLGTARAKEGETNQPVAMIQREEHDGIHCYYVRREMVHTKGGNSEKFVPREDFGTVANLILQAIKSSSEGEVTSPDGMEKFLDEVAVFDLEVEAEDHTDFYIAFWHPEASLGRFSVRSRLGTMGPLLGGGRAANLKLEQSEVRFATPTVNKTNALPEAPNEVAERVLLVERLGDVLKCSDVADRVFRSNPLMIDLHFPRVLAEVVRIVHLDDITHVSELAEIIKQMNPPKIKDGLVNKHGFYKFEVKQFLMASALGMRPARIYTGQDSAVESILLMDEGGEILCYHKSERPIMEDFPFLNTRLEKGSLDRDKYGFLERENSTYYFKLDAKIGLIKR